MRKAHAGHPRRARLAMLACGMIVSACADAAGPGTRSDARDLAGDLQAATAALETTPWLSYAATRLGPDANLLPTAATSEGTTWTWDTERERYRPSRLPGGPPGTARFVLYPLDSLGRRIEPPGNPVGYADVNAQDGRRQAFHVVVGGGPTRYADYVIRGADIARTGDAIGIFTAQDVEARLTMSYGASSPDAGRADFRLSVPSRDLSVRVSTEYSQRGSSTAFRASLRSSGTIMEATGSLTDDGSLQMILLQDHRPVAVAGLAGDSAIVTGARGRVSGPLAEAASGFGKLVRAIVRTRKSLSAPVAQFQN